MSKQPTLATITRYVKEHLHFLADFRRWRLKPAVLRTTPVKVDVLWHQPPQTHLLLGLGEGLLFYLPLLLSPERIKALGDGIEIELDQERWRIYDPYHEGAAFQALLRAVQSGNAGRLRLDMPGMGHYARAARNPLVGLRTARVQPLLDEGGEPSSNYLYKLNLRSDSSRVECILKRYLPRDKPEAGEREWRLATTLSSELVPRPLGRLRDSRSELTLGGFYELVEGEEVGALLWRLMERLGKDPFRSVLSRLRVIFGKALNTLAALYNQLDAKLSGGSERGEVVAALVEKARGDFQTVKRFHPNAQSFQRTLGKLEEYAESGAYHGPRPIHGDLMWRQILWRNAPATIPVAPPGEVPGRLTLLDTESWRWGFLEEDLAGLSAANNFMLQRLGHAEYAPGVFAALWHAAVEQLGGHGETAQLTDVKPLLSLVRLRHLHDAAYYTLAKSRQLVKSEEYEGFVRNSLAMAGLSRKEFDGP